jgi:putative redox protein
MGNRSMTIISFRDGRVDARMGSMSESRFIASAHAQSMTGYQQRVRIGDHLLVADEPASLGGNNAGPTPFGYVIGGLAACTAITLQIYSQRKGWPLGALKVDIRIFDGGELHRIERTITVGQPLTPEQHARLLAIAEKTPVTKLLKRTATIVTTLA